MCNCGFLDIASFQKNAKLTIVSSTSIVEGGAHDVLLKNKNISTNQQENWIKKIIHNKKIVVK